MLFVYFVSHHSGILSPTGRLFSWSNDLIIVADLHWMLQQCMCAHMLVSVNEICVCHKRYRTICLGHDIMISPNWYNHWNISQEKLEVYTRCCSVAAHNSNSLGRQAFRWDRLQYNEQTNESRPACEAHHTVAHPSGVPIVIMLGSS